jgi:uncharacterized protein YkwD
VIVAGALLISLAGGPERLRALADRDDGGCPGSARVPTAGSLEEARGATLCLLNLERRAHGLPPFTLDRRLSAAAEGHSRDMGARDFYAHQNPDGVGPARRIYAQGVERSGTAVAENIHWGVEVSARPKQIVRDWMESPGHRANILNPTLTEIGIGIGFDAPEAVRGRAAVYTTTFSGSLAAG